MSNTCEHVCLMINDWDQSQEPHACIVGSLALVCVVCSRFNRRWVTAHATHTAPARPFQDSRPYTHSRRAWPHASPTHLQPQANMELYKNATHPLHLIDICRSTPPWRRPPPHSFSCTRAPFAGAGLVPAWVVRSQRRRRRTPRFTWRSSSSSTSSPAGTRCPWWPPSSSEWVLEVSACFCDIATRVPARILW